MPSTFTNLKGRVPDLFSLFDSLLKAKPSPLTFTLTSSTSPFLRRLVENVEVSVDVVVDHGQPKAHRPKHRLLGRRRIQVAVVVIHPAAVVQGVDP